MDLARATLVLIRVLRTLINSIAKNLHKLQICLRFYSFYKKTRYSTYYFENEVKTENSNCAAALNYIVSKNISGYKYSDNYAIYERKNGTLLYDMFCGMRLSTDWNGKSSVNGGYIVIKNDGDVVAFHSTIADESKQFLIRQLGFESPSATRHNYMKIEKENGEYFVNLNLQIRFKKIKETSFSIDKEYYSLCIAEK